MMNEKAREDIEIYDSEEMIRHEYEKEMKKITERAEAELMGEELDL